jgi:hypothetical protein
MTAKATDKLAAAAAEITPKDLQGSGPKTEFLQFRVSKSEKESIQNTASKLGIQVSEYLLKLHELVSQRLIKGNQMETINSFIGKE